MKLNFKKKCWSKHILIVLLVTLLLPLSFLTNIKPAQAATLPLTGLSEDYLFYNSANPPSIWADKLSYFTQWHANTARMGFTFANDPGVFSNYNYTKMDAVLDYLASVNVKAVLCYFAIGTKYGSQQWVDNWKGVATDFIGDDRIKAFELVNEPYDGQLSPTGPTGGVTDLASFNTAFAYLVDQIRVIDSSRTIMYPLVMNILSDSWATIYNSLVSHGIPAKGNMLYDITHPYFFENAYDMGLTPVQKANWYLSNHILPAIASFGAANVWCGETFTWPPSEGYHHDLQVAFLTQMINNLVYNNVGFQILAYFSTEAANRAWMNEALTASSYYSVYVLSLSPPQYGSHSVSTNLAGQSATFVCAWTDDYGLSQGKLCTNYTGSWHNQTAVALSGTSASFSDLAVLPFQGGKVLAYRFYAKDTSNLWNVTATYYLTTVASNPPAPPITPPTSNPVTINTVLYVYPTWHFGYITSSAYINFEAPITLSSSSRYEDYWYFNEYAFQTDANITITNFFTNNRLVYNVTANSTVVTNFIYIANKGMPTSVLGAQSWSYDPAAKIITLQVTGLGTVTVTLIFGPIGGGGGFSLPYWLPFLFRAAAILIPFGIIAYYFGKIKDVKSGTLTIVVILTCFIVFFIMWYFAMALEALI